MRHAFLSRRINDSSWYSDFLKIKSGEIPPTKWCQRKDKYSKRTLKGNNGSEWLHIFTNYISSPTGFVHVPGAENKVKHFPHTPVTSPTIFLWIRHMLQHGN
ncbi:hypothetical protein, unlikely [Trypanosoma brucei gambiense DAL972]|uniref:Uncharacterized protein n=1 Tax=Trypanosoma brucei gambiense (strain MHOM/CI/86/DAL972) TaxID=679716 RepID=D0A1W9_TRYB9|nr:hypothetical protein, unlikely [Trypanosoma brucei gambiense DAL972]CBH15262.1 hypothetical protein, unlikely [Trypanosoma brucei gambiense DAL972]|eukprot:XP_011777527.1 hypothetical protein, unlikely [Trypanosoma brucei gambiense DAL972]